jgi:hypothetical protein
MMACCAIEPQQVAAVTQIAISTNMQQKKTSDAMTLVN